MENIKFVSVEKIDDAGAFAEILTTEKIFVYRFKLHDGIVAMIHKYTECPEEYLSEELSEDNELIYSLALSEDEFDSFHKTFIETVEKIANSTSTKEFYETVLSDHGDGLGPSEMHEMMETRYNLTGHVEWYTALLFTQISELIFAPRFLWVDDD